MVSSLPEGERFKMPLCGFLLKGGGSFLSYSTTLLACPLCEPDECWRARPPLDNCRCIGAAGTEGMLMRGRGGAKRGRHTRVEGEVPASGRHSIAASVLPVALAREAVAIATQPRPLFTLARYQSCCLEIMNPP